MYASLGLQEKSEGCAQAPSQDKAHSACGPLPHGALPQAPHRHTLGAGPTSNPNSGADPSSNTPTRLQWNPHLSSLLRHMYNTIALPPCVCVYLSRSMAWVHGSMGWSSKGCAQCKGGWQLWQGGVNRWGRL